MAKRILIADDNGLMRRQVRTILEPDETVEICAEATDGVEALEKAREYRPDLAVLDFMMPRMNGLEATREIKKIMPAMPVLLLPLESSPQLEWEGKRAGADAIVVKSEASRRLLTVLHSLLERSRDNPPLAHAI
jgi:DNA-binding NarL/FixJ family response regulator